jgi:hypothetical protein
LPSPNPQTRKTVARIAASARWGNTSPELDRERTEYAAERLAAYIEKIVAQAPPLTPAQRDRLALLLRGGDQVA